MAIEEKVKEQDEEATNDEAVLGEEEEKDLEVCVLLGKQLIAQGGDKIIASAMKSKDPGQVIGQFLVQLGSQMGEMLPDDMKPSPAIMLAEGGWLEQMSDFLQEEYDLERDVADRAEIYVAQAAQDIATAQQAPAAPAGAPAPAAPAGPVMPGAV